MMKKLLVLMTAILLATAMTACGGGTTSYDEPAPAEPAAAAEPAAEAGPIEPTEATSNPPSPSLVGGARSPRQATPG